MESGGGVAETEAKCFLMADGRDQFVVQINKRSFCGVAFSEVRLVRVEK